MRRRLFTILAVLSLLVAGLLAPAAWAQTQDEITGIQWQWTMLRETDPTGQSVVPDPENYVMVLMEDGSAPLKADCNQVLWSYTLEGTTITFNTLGPATLAFCGETSSDQVFLENLGKGGTLSFEEERLVLTFADGSGMMAFQNGGPVPEAPGTVPEAGGAPLVVPWVATALAGLASLTTGVALRRRK